MLPEGLFICCARGGRFCDRANQIVAIVHRTRPIIDRRITSSWPRMHARFCLSMIAGWTAKVAPVTHGGMRGKNSHRRKGKVVSKRQRQKKSRPRRRPTDAPEPRKDGRGCVQRWAAPGRSAKTREFHRRPPYGSKAHPGFSAVRPAVARGRFALLKKQAIFIRFFFLFFVAIF